jgi:hypothetical protein
VKIGAIGSFEKSEDFEEGASEYRGAGGPLQVRGCPSWPPTLRIASEAEAV